jgi:opacity protein-like surface antigen
LFKNGLLHLGNPRSFAFTPALWIAAASLLGTALVSTASLAQNVAATSSSSADTLATATVEDGSGLARPLQAPAKQAKPTGVKGFDISLGTFAQLTGTRTQVDGFRNGPTSSIYYETSQGEAPSAGLLGTIHQQFSSWLGYNVNFGYTKTTENYFIGPYQTSPGSIPTHVFEMTASAVARGPVSSRRVQTFVQGGGGTLAFLPAQSPFKGSVQFRPTVLFGAGVEYRLSDHLAVRAEYRGLFYKNPDFRNPSTAPLKLFTVTNEPTITLVYRFGSRKTGT